MSGSFPAGAELSLALSALTDEQKEAVSDVAVLKDSGIVLNYSATGELPVSIDMDALGKFIADTKTSSPIWSTRPPSSPRRSTTAP